MDDIEIIFLCQGCQGAVDIANMLADFMRRANSTLDISIYSFSLCPEAHEIIAGALKDRANAGVQIRIAYDAGTQHEDLKQQGLYSDPCDIRTPDFIASLGYPSKAIEGYRALMHDKYVLVDAGTPNAQVWTGSTNWTDDSWRLEENNIVILHSRDLVDCYEQDFNDLWVDANISGATVCNTAETTLRYKGQPAYVQAYFSPVEGELINDTLAKLVEGAKDRITLASVVVTSGKILNAFLTLMRRGVPLEGIYDGTQMEGVKQQWEMVPSNHWKIPAWQQIVDYGHLVGKKSTPYTPDSQHDYMHNKVMVVDNTVVTGSYNFSRHAQGNAENLLIIESPALAATYRQYIGKITAMYEGQPGPTPVPAAPAPEIGQPEPNR